MNKKLFSVILACIMCFSVLFTGCAEENGKSNVNTNDGNNEQVSTDILGKIDASIGDKI